MAPTRLINTETLEFETRFAHLHKDDLDYPHFAIVSHRWEDQEISYQEFLYFTGPQDDRNSTVARILGLDLSKENGKGLAKVRSACSVGRERGYEWLWIDTCCINKDSSAELSEAINSMYEWYRDAAECLVYFSTVAAGRVDFEDKHNEFWESEWWHRGWTLQELVAPQHLSFWDQSWQFLVSRHNLGHSIARKTGIPSECLGDGLRIRATSIATRISWARSRQTSRLEDTAYSLLGICDINMPLLYGEGTRAFRRLQEAIITRSNDESIFAVDDGAQLFATSPADFCQSPMLQGDLCKRTTGRAFSVAQGGVRMHISYLNMGYPVWAVVFNCRYATLDWPFIRLFNVTQRDVEFETTRLVPKSYRPEDDDLLLQAHDSIEQSFSNRQDVYKYEDVILSAATTI